MKGVGNFICSSWIAVPPPGSRSLEACPIQTRVSNYSIPSGEGTQGAFALQSESEGREMLCSLLFAHLENRQCVLRAALWSCQCKTGTVPMQKSQVGLLNSRVVGHVFDLQVECAWALEIWRFVVHNYRTLMFTHSSPARAQGTWFQMVKHSYYGIRTETIKTQTQTKRYQHVLNKVRT